VLAPTKVAQAVKIYAKDIGWYWHRRLGDLRLIFSLHASYFA